jgi:hypothetical protein
MSNFNFSTGRMTKCPRQPYRYMNSELPEKPKKIANKKASDAGKRQF